jgi:AraC-like DNA-binding protein
MSSAHKYVAVNNPDIPLLTAESNSDPRMGVLTDVSGLMTSPDNVTDVPSGFEAHLHDIYLPQATVRTYRGKFAYNVRLVTESGANGERVGSCLFLDGRMTTVLNGRSKGVIVNRGQQNFKYDPNHEFSHWGDADTSYHIVHFSIDPQYFISFLPHDEPWADRLMNSILKRERVIGENPAYISLQQHKAIQNLFDCPMSGKMAQILMETSVIQIVLWQLHALFRDEDSTRPSGITSRDRDVAVSLKEYLTATFLEGHSLTSLARHFGVNANKLMFLFKSVFGTSIFEYISDLKMEYAMRLIREDRKFVTEAARILGYKNPHHFSAAFKKKFGICPSSVK